MIKSMKPFLFVSSANRHFMQTYDYPHVIIIFLKEEFGSKKIILFLSPRNLFYGATVIIEMLILLRPVLVKYLALLCEKNAER